MGDGRDSVFGLSIVLLWTSIRLNSETSPLIRSILHQFRRLSHQHLFAHSETWNKFGFGLGFGLWLRSWWQGLSWGRPRGGREWLWRHHVFCNAKRRSLGFICVWLEFWVVCWKCERRMMLDRTWLTYSLVVFSSRKSGVENVFVLGQELPKTTTRKRSDFRRYVYL